MHDPTACFSVRQNLVGVTHRTFPWALSWARAGRVNLTTCSKDTQNSTSCTFCQLIQICAFPDDPSLLWPTKSSCYVCWRSIDKFVSPVSHQCSPHQDVQGSPQRSFDSRKYFKTALHTFYSQPVVLFWFHGTSCSWVSMAASFWQKLFTLSWVT